MYVRSLSAKSYNPGVVCVCVCVWHVRPEHVALPIWVLRPTSSLRLTWLDLWHASCRTVVVMCSTMMTNHAAAARKDLMEEEGRRLCSADASHLDPVGIWECMGGSNQASGSINPPRCISLHRMRFITYTQCCLSYELANRVVTGFYFSTTASFRVLMCGAGAKYKLLTLFVSRRKCPWLIR